MGKRTNVICSAVILRVKRWVKAVLGQIPWFAIFTGILWYGKHHIDDYISQAFNLSVYTKNALFWQKRVNQIYNSLSLTNPFGYADYMSALSASAFASAKAATARQTVLLLSDILSSTLNLVWIVGCFYVIIRVLRSYRDQTRKSEIADEVIARLLPLLEEIKNKNQKSSSKGEEVI